MPRFRRSSPVKARAPCAIRSAESKPGSDCSMARCCFVWYHGNCSTPQSEPMPGKDWFLQKCCASLQRVFNMQLSNTNGKQDSPYIIQDTSGCRRYLLEGKHFYRPFCYWKPIYSFVISPLCLTLRMSGMFPTLCNVF